MGGTIEETRRNDNIEMPNDENVKTESIISHIYKAIRETIKKNIKISSDKGEIIYHHIFCGLKEAHRIHKYEYEGGKDDYRFNKSIRDFIQTKLDESPIISKCEKN